MADRGIGANGPARSQQAFQACRSSSCARAAGLGLTMLPWRCPSFGSAVVAAFEYVPRALEALASSIAHVETALMCAEATMLAACPRNPALLHEGNSAHEYPTQCF